MAKVVKHCAVCNENFAERFGFCPNCGASLAAYDMSSLAGTTSIGDAVNNAEAKTSPAVATENALPATASEPKSEPVVAASAAQTFSTSVGERHLSENGRIVKDETAAVIAPAGIIGEYK